MPFAAGDLGIDEDAQVAAVLAHVDDDDLLVDVDLGRGQAHAGCGVHGLAMSSISLRVAASIFSTRWAGSGQSRGSGYWRISRMAINAC
jgi:hypothetical protein